MNTRRFYYESNMNYDKEGSPKIFLSAGEHSGDIHGGKLVKELKQLFPESYLFGLGGDNMANIGMELFAHVNQLAAIGITEVLSRIGFFYKLLKQVRKLFDNLKPDLVILIDYPGFNLRIAGEAKKRNIKVLYYISPQIWAWREGRKKKIARRVDKLAVVFPFEVELYNDVDLDVEFVGHPLLEKVSENDTKEEDFFSRNELDKSKPFLALLPGSREQELNYLLPTFLAISRKLKDRFPELQVCLLLAPTISRDWLYTLDGINLDGVKIISNDSRKVIQSAHLLLIKSGTSTLEAAILGTPMVICYKASYITYLIAKMLVKVPYIGLVNLVRGKKIVPEFYQRDIKVKNILPQLVKLCDTNSESRRIMIAELKKVRQRLGEKGASRRVGQIAREMIEGG